MARALLFSLIASLLACSAAQGRGSSPVGLEQRELVGVVMSDAQARALLTPLLAEQPTAFWTPERGQAVALEAAVESFLAEAAPPGSRLRRGLDGYRAQHFGILRGDQELILANFFCDSLGVDVTEQLVMATQGADCHFTVLYDPATSGFEELRVRNDR